LICCVVFAFILGFLGRAVMRFKMVTRDTGLDPDLKIIRLLMVAFFTNTICFLLYFMTFPISKKDDKSNLYSVITVVYVMSLLFSQSMICYVCYHTAHQEFFAE